MEKRAQTNCLYARLTVQFTYSNNFLIYCFNCGFQFLEYQLDNHKPHLDFAKIYPILICILKAGTLHNAACKQGLVDPGLHSAGFISSRCRWLHQLLQLAG